MSTLRFENVFVPYEPSLIALTSTKDPKPVSSLLSADVIEKQDSFEVHADLPGVPAEAIELAMHDHVLEIKANRPRCLSPDTATDKTLRSERAFGMVQRKIQLPKTADAQHATSKLKDGVLIVSFPKVEEPSSRRIPVVSE